MACTRERRATSTVSLHHAAAWATTGGDPLGAAAFTAAVLVFIGDLPLPAGAFFAARLDGLCRKTENVARACLLCSAIAFAASVSAFPALTGCFCLVLAMVLRQLSVAQLLLPFAAPHASAGMRYQTVLV